MNEPKTILVNDLSVYRQRSGVGSYVDQLLRHLHQVDDDGVRIVRLGRTLSGTPLRLLSGLYEKSQRRPSNLTSTASPTADVRGTASTSARGLRSTAVALAKQFGHSMLNGYAKVFGRLHRFAIYHEPDTLPLEIDTPTVATFHDLSVLLFPHWHPKHRVQKYERNLRDGIRRTSLFLANSETTKRDMVRHLGIAPERIHVALLAPRAEFREVPKPHVAFARERLQLPEQYLLFVGNIEPRKNVAGLLRAYARLPGRLRAQTPLVLVGGWGWHSDDVRDMLARAPWNESVRWLGYLPDDDLVAVVNGALAVVYPSYYEGFGMPPLEAMACGRPVITTHAGSLREVIGDAALIVEPDNDDQLVQALSAMITEPDLAKVYAERGRRHLQKFSWERTARQTLDAYRRVA